MSDIKEIFESRRSVNFFNPSKKIEREVLESIINLAVLSPSAFNLQPWEIIAVSSDEAKSKLCALSNNQPKILEAPITLIIIGDMLGYESNNLAWLDLEKAVGKKEIVEGAQKAALSLYGSSFERKVMFAQSNAGLLSMSIMYAAKYYGVDSHPMSGIDFEAIKKSFEIGEEKEVVMLISLGYFDESKTLFKRSYRRNYNEIVKEV